MEIRRDCNGEMVGGKNLFTTTYSPYKTSISGIFPDTRDDSIDAVFYSLNRKDIDFDYAIVPKNRLLDLQVDYNPSEIGKWSMECLDPWLIAKNDLEKVIKGKEENKMADTNRILYRYEDIEAQKIRKHYDEKSEKVESESTEAKIAKKVKEYALKELKKAFPDYDESKESIITVTFKNTDETRIKLEELNKERIKDLEKLDEKIQEIKAILEIAETFEQKMQILFAYNVVNNEGVMKK